MPNAVQHLTFAALASQAATRTTLISCASGWVIQARSGRHSHLLMAERSKAPRVFRRMDTAANYLRKVGVTTFVVEIAEPVAPQTPPSRRRPDRSSALQRTFASANEWEKWFTAQATAAVQEANSPQAHWVPHEEVKARANLRRTKLLALAKTQRAA